MIMKRLVSVIIVAALVVQQSSCAPVEDGNEGATGHKEVITENITEPITAVNANGNDTAAVNGTAVDDEWLAESKNRVVCRPVNPIVPVEGDNHEYHYVRIDWNQTVREHYVVHVAVSRSEYDGYGAPATVAGQAFGADARHLVCRSVNETEPSGPVLEQQPSRMYMVKMINATGPVNGSGDFHVQVVNQSGYKVYADGETAIASEEHRISCHFTTPHRNGAQILCTASPPVAMPLATNSTADSEDHSTTVTNETPAVTTTTGMTPAETTTTGTTPAETTTTGTTPTFTTTTGTTPTFTTTTGTTPTFTTTTVTTPTFTTTTGMASTEMTPTQTTPTVTTLTKDNSTLSRRSTVNLIKSTVSPKEGNVICRLASQMENPNSDHTHYIIHMANRTEENPRTKTSRSLENQVFCRFTNRSDLNTTDYNVYQVYMLKNNTDVEYGSYSRNLTTGYIIG